MDLFVINQWHAREDLAHDFSSMIWTERYNSKGEIKITADPHSKIARQLRVGTRVGLSETDEYMIIQERLKTRDESGKAMLSIAGYSGASLMELRALGTNSRTGTMDFRGTSGYAAFRIVEKIMVNGEDIYELDAMPDLSAVNNARDTPFKRFEVRPQSVYSAVKEICDAEDLGFTIRLIGRNTGKPSIQFRVYSGIERPNVVFSQTMDNLANESYLESIVEYYNTAYVWASGGTTRYTVYAKNDGNANKRGVDRRILHVDANDIEPDEMTVTELREAMTQRGLAALSEKKRVDLFDGEITPWSQFKYRKHYWLGDTVTFISEEGRKYRQVVAEHIWAMDDQGLSSYPTFKAPE